MPVLKNKIVCFCVWRRGGGEVVFGYWPTRHKPPFIWSVLSDKLSAEEPNPRLNTYSY